ncbi:hypothetical protein DFO70_1442 [Cytobacillus firmus]|uniref:IstB-like ATP-binding domain-containing protein n=3 Tax=Bacillaceae TaxID=186817 RepID=A0A366JGE8_CYTFI|nr:hypothetical protein DFO70_1442 [Cytobacillus firmus]TDX35478.1 hypothetical protein DFO72_12712 [Cytobacillus oceanisediminis]
MAENPFIATAILYRLLYHAGVFILKGNSYRLKRKANEDTEGLKSPSVEV